MISLQLHRALHLVIPISLLLTSISLAETLYVTAKSAKIRAGITSLDDVKDTVHYGDSVESLRAENEWIEVKTKSGAQGWLHTSKVSATPPEGAGSWLPPIPTKTPSGSSKPVVTAGARGLDKAAEGYAERNGISPQSRKAVDNMTAHEMTDEQVENFLKEGGLGDYAK